MKKGELRALATRLDFELGTLERDYAITALLPLLFPRQEDPLMVFKGGTALNKTHLGYRRLSEDLDFTALVGDIELILDAIQEGIVSGRDQGDVLFEEPEVRGRGSLRVKYTGPLEFTSTVRIEISTRERPTMQPEWITVPHEYHGEFGDFEVYMMTLDEMISEKMRASMNPRRAKPRDIMDLVFVEEVESGILARTLGMARHKCEAIGEEFGIGLIAVKREEYRRKWVDDLRSLLRGRSPPDFDATFDRLLALLEQGISEED